MFLQWLICVKSWAAIPRVTARCGMPWRISGNGTKKDQKPETFLRLGVGEVLLGRYTSGLEQLKRAGEVGMAYFFQGLAFENLR